MFASSSAAAPMHEAEFNRLHEDPVNEGGALTTLTELLTAVQINVDQAAADEVIAAPNDCKHHWEQASATTQEACSRNPGVASKLQDESSIISN
jgi:hypothetical protein